MKNDLETTQSDVFFPDFPEKKGEKCTFATKISAFPARLAGLQKKFLASQRRWQACKKILRPS